MTDPHPDIVDLVAGVIAHLQDDLGPERINRLSELFLDLAHQFEQQKETSPALRDGWVVKQLLLQAAMRVYLERELGREIADPGELLGSTATH